MRFQKNVEGYPRRTVEVEIQWTQPMGKSIKGLRCALRVIKSWIRGHKGWLLKFNGVRQVGEGVRNGLQEETEQLKHFVVWQLGAGNTWREKMPNPCCEPRLENSQQWPSTMDNSINAWPFPKLVTTFTHQGALVYVRDAISRDSKAHVIVKWELKCNNGELSASKQVDFP